jgi:hypothetical protein
VGTFDRLEDRTAPAVFTVTTTADSGPGSLRQAVGFANADAAADTIAFDPSLAGQTVTLFNAGDASNGGTALPVTEPVTIAGSGQTLTRSSPTPFRFFSVPAGVSVTL